MDVDLNVPTFRDPQGEDAVVFLYWDWSGQARTGRRLFEEWVHQYRPSVQTFIVLPDEDKEAADWLGRECLRAGQGFHGGAHGSALFVRRGQVVYWIARVDQSSVEEIERFYQRTRSPD